MVLLDVLLVFLHLGAGIVVDLLHAHIFLAATELGSIDGDKETLHTALLGVLDVLFGDLAVTVDVELKEELLVVLCRVDDVINGARSEGGNLRSVPVSKPS